MWLCMKRRGVGSLYASEGADGQVDYRSFYTAWSERASGIAGGVVCLALEGSWVGTEF